MAIIMSRRSCMVFAKSEKFKPWIFPWFFCCSKIEVITFRMKTNLNATSTSHANQSCKSSLIFFVRFPIFLWCSFTLFASTCHRLNRLKCFRSVSHCAVSHIFLNSLICVFINVNAFSSCSSLPITRSSLPFAGALTAVRVSDRRR